MGRRAHSPSRQSERIAAVKAIAIYSVLGAILGIGAVIAFGLALHYEKKVRRLLLPAMLFMISIMPSVVLLIGWRDLSLLEIREEPDSTMLTWILRFITASLVAACVVRIFGHFSEKGRQPLKGQVLIACFMLYWSFNYLMNAAFGLIPTATIGQTPYAALVFFTLFVSATADRELVIRFVKLGLMAVMVVSLLMLVVDVDLVAMRDMPNRPAEIRISGMPFRFFGLTPHANTIAPMALASILLTIYQPFRNRLLEVVNVGAAVIVIVIAQSQTTWMGMVPAFLITLWGRTNIDLTSRSTVTRGLLLAGVAGLLVLAGVMLDIDSPTLTMIVDPSRAEHVVSLTGRDVIWEGAVEAWRENPLFGYGPTIWNSEFRARTGLLTAPTAHNQFFQSLSRAGIFGVSALFIYVSALAYNSFKLPRRDRGVCLGMLATLLTVCITETPLDVGGPFSGHVTLHMTLFLLIVMGLNRRESGEEQRASVRVKRIDPAEPATNAVVARQTA
jgi:O-antigen ligase